MQASHRAALAAAAAAPAPPRLAPALVIPVWNDADGLARLLDQVRRAGLFSQIVVVDDGSDCPVAQAPDLTLIRHARPMGGGVARNTGLAAVQASHVLFFDADDLPTGELADLLADLHGQDFDFCLFRHADSRVAAELRRGQPDWDDVHWQASGHAIGTLAEAGAAARAHLVQTANYPWNKVYRTGFLRQHGIGCAPTMVHQDIPLHWLGFLKAGQVLVSDRICAWHQVAMAGDRLTNRTGPERLQVFEALEPVGQAAATADPAMRLALARFVPGLVDWIAARIDPALLPRLRQAEADWLTRHVAPWMDAVESADKALAVLLRDRMILARAGA